jgi:hypothetical protein
MSKILPEKQDVLDANWHDCPENIEVIELSTVIKTPAQSDD